MVGANELADICEVSRQTVTRWCYEGCPFETVKQRSRYVRRFDPVKVQQWYESRKHPRTMIMASMREVL